MARTPGAHDDAAPSAPSPTPDDCVCVLCGERIGSQPWAQLACGAEHVAHNVCLFESALASECCAVRCGRAGCGRTTQVSSATTVYAGVRRLGASRCVAVAAGPGRDGARSGSAAALEASGPALAALPFDLLVRVLVHLGSARDLAAANAASRLFRGAPGRGSAVEHALRERVRARGHERALPTLPRTWTAELLERERVLEMSARHACVAACGDNKISAFVDAEGGLHTCGEVEEEEDEDDEPESDDEDEEVVPGHFAPLAIAHGRQVPPVYVPTRVASLSAVRVVAVAAGSDHLLALSDAGAVYGCGDDSAGQLGLGDTDREEERSFTLVGLPAREPVVCIAAGNTHSLALTAAGCAYSWGFNGNGQLGHGDTQKRLVPTRIEALSGVRVGGMAAGELKTLLLSTQGAVYSCGVGCHGTLGHGDQHDQHTPRRIEALAGVRAVHVSVGGAHSLVVDTEGVVYSFGFGKFGSLGHGDTRPQLTPRRLDALAGVRIVRACAGGLSSAVLGADGSVHTFGDNRDGQLGLGSGEVRHGAPSRVGVLAHARVVQCAMSYHHSLFVSADGSVYACGKRSAALGLGMSEAEQDEPTQQVDTPACIGTAWCARVS